MENKLDILTKKLYEEGVEKARTEAEEIVRKAKEEAAKLIDTKVQRAYGVLRKMENDGVLRSVRSGKKNIYFLDRR